VKTRDDPEYDKLFKVRQFVDSKKSSFREIEVEDYNSVDELKYCFQRSELTKKYVRNKPHKCGIKVFARAGSSGIVYVGRGNVKMMCMWGGEL
jgi:hypothetical protein